MNNLNSVLLEGNLTNSVDLSYTPQGTAVCKFSIAVNRSYKENGALVKEVSYFDISTWARLAEVCGEYLARGRGVRVVGRLRQDRWTDNDGKAHSRVYVVAEHVEFRPQVKKVESEPTDQAQAESPTDGELDEAEATGTTV